MSSLNIVLAITLDLLKDGFGEHDAKHFHVFVAELKTEGKMVCIYIYIYIYILIILIK